MSYFEKAIQETALDTTNWTKEDYQSLAKKIPPYVWKQGQEQDSLAKQFQPHVKWVNENLSQLCCTEA